MPLTKSAIITIISAVQAVAGEAASLVCTTAPPVTVGPGGVVATPPSSGPYIYLYVPSNPAVFVSETRRQAIAPAPAGYVCSLGSYIVPDPTFPGGSIVVRETRCFWTYP